MAIKKSELYSSLWKSCDELRGGMDASPLPALEQQVTDCQSHVEEHLKKMGFDWAPATNEGRA